MSGKRAVLMIASVLMVIAVFIAGYSFGKNSYNPNNPVDNGGVACTEEAKLCPDGTAVGRQGPNCEFPECPSDTPAKP